MANAVRSTESRKSRDAHFLALILIFVSLFLWQGCAGLVGANQPGGNPSPSTLTISSTAAGGITLSSASVSWQTNLPATSQIEYGTSSSYGSTTALDPSLVTNHQQGMSGLKSSTLYHFRVRSRDANNNEAVSADMTVTTAATPDTTPPTVSITSPAANTTISGTITVTATASDNVGVVGVQFKVDGNNIGAEDASSPYSASLNTTPLSNGSHTLMAVALDAAGNTTTSAGVTVNVSNTSPDTTAPTVSITAPAQGSTVSGTISVSATASDNVGIAGVQFKLDGNNLGAEDTSSPYSVSWNTTTVSNGNHSVTAVARDAAGNQTTTAAVTVNVNNASADTTPPTVSISSPASGVTVSGSITVAALASDNVGVSSVQFRVDGNNTGAADTSSPYSISLDTTALTNGSHVLSAVARDAAGNSTTSAGVTINVSNASTAPPAGSGWTQLANTHLEDVCPPDQFGYAYTFYCYNVIAAWSGGIADPVRNRLIMFGGGHGDYYGNELYALDLNTQKLMRVTDPSPPNGPNPPIGPNIPCITTLSDGNPNSRHSYGGMAYIAHADKMFLFGGSLACSAGDGGNDTWALDLATYKWTRLFPTGGTPTPVNLVASADYDPNTKLVFLHDRSSLWSFNYDTNVYTRLSDFFLTVSTTGVIDPKRKLFIFMGMSESGGPMIQAVSIAAGSNYAVQDWSSASGCSALASAEWPGLAYDPVQDRIIGWANESGKVGTVYTFNPDTRSCTAQAISGGPAFQAETRGVFGRFRYFPGLNVFAVVNEWRQNAFLLHMTAGGGSTPPSGPVISSVAVSNITQTSATVSWTTNVGATTQVDYGTSSAYGSSTTLNSSLVTSHSQTLSGLTPNTVYHYRVRSKDSGNNETLSNDAVFATNATSDTTAPTVSISSPASGATLLGSVSVLASASDNVGVSGVQFLLDGANMGAEVTSAPYSTTWDTTGAANGTHALAARARDAAGNVTTSPSVSVSVSNASAPPIGSADFNTRCSAAGVLRCYGFDDDADAAQYIEPGDCVPRCGSVDTSTAASGLGSLRFKIPGQGGDGSAGSFKMAFTPNFSWFGGAVTDSWPGATTGQDFYIQWRQRFDTNLLTQNYGADADGFKQVIIAEPDFNSTQYPPSGRQGNACSDNQIVLQNVSARGLPQVYHSCGFKDGQYEPLNVYNSARFPGKYLLQNGPAPPAGAYCIWNDPYVDPPCAIYKPNQWITFQIHVHIGTWYTNNGVYKRDSAVQMWVAYEGQTSRLVLDWSPTSLDSGAQGYDLASSIYAAVNKYAPYGKIWLTPYMTHRDTGVVNQDAFTWYDELIISTQRIADPQ